MIPKPLPAVTWDDIIQLKDSAREEDNTLEFKASFSGGDDFVAFSDSQRVKAVDGIVQEAIAFLNAQGGDIVIGARERTNDHPCIEEILPLPNAAPAADRLAQALAAIIEPAQSVLQVRAILDSQGGRGVIVVRAPASLRAPHRSKRTKDCFVRRGRESVPMPMDEIQDLTIRRNELLRDHLSLADRQFNGFEGQRVGRTLLDADRFHIRAALVPTAKLQIQINEQTKAIINCRDPLLSRGSRSERLTVPFRPLDSNWKPVLRGARLENRQNMSRGEGDFLYAAKEIKESGLYLAEFACHADVSDGSPAVWGFYFDWIGGFAGNFLLSARALADIYPALDNALIRVGIYSSGGMVGITGERMWREAHKWPSGLSFLPDFDMPSRDTLNGVLEQMRVDAASLAGFEFEAPYQFAQE